MSTNYYFLIKDKDFVQQYFPNEYELTDTPYFGYQVHIGKRSNGWKPLFQRHKNAYSSVKEMMKFIEENQEQIRIFDEYGTEFTLEGLDAELVSWALRQNTKYWTFKPEGEYDPILQSMAYFVPGTNEDHDLTSPFDHVIYDEFESRVYPRMTRFFYHDENGFDFIDCEFC